MRRVCTFTLLSVLAAAPVALGQVPVKHPFVVHVLPQGGLAVASGDAADGWDPSIALGGELEVGISPPFALTGSLFYNKFSPKTTLSDEHATIVEASASIKYQIAPTPVVKPHIRFGLGLYHRDTGGAETHTNFGADGGGGVDIDVPRSRLGFTASARFHKIFVTSTSFKNPSWQYFTLTAGLRLRLF